MQTRTLVVIVETEDETALSLPRDLVEWLQEHDGVQRVVKVRNSPTNPTHHTKRMPDESR